MWGRHMISMLMLNRVCKAHITADRLMPSNWMLFKTVDCRWLPSAVHSHGHTLLDCRLGGEKLVAQLNGMRLYGWPDAGPIAHCHIADPFIRDGAWPQNCNQFQSIFVELFY